MAEGAAATIVSVIVDGEPCEVRADQPILRVLEARGIAIPTLCHDDRLAPVGHCRSCLVEVNGGAHLQPACMTMPAAGMIVETRTEALVAYRRSVVELLASRYPASAVAAAPDKEFHRWLAAFGLTPSGAAAQDAGLRDRSHPYIAVDMSRCIECERCVRICREVQGQDVWHVRNRGSATRIVPDGPTLLESSCVSCGACVDTCPTSALTDRRLDPSEPPTAWTRTTCPYCGTGCEMRVGTRNGAIVSIRPEPDAPVSKGHLCVKGRYAFEFVTAPDRVTEPMIREADGWRRVSWDEAIAFVATRLQAIVARHGPESVGVLGSARATNEDNYLAQKFARVALGTNNVDCCARVCHAPSAAALKLVLGSGMATNAFDDIELARTIVVWGANATEDHPIVGARIRQAARRGARLIVVDPRRVELAAEADVHLAIRPGTNVPLLNAMAQVILAEGLADAAFLASRVDGLEAYAQSVAAWTPARAAAICGVEASAIEAAARLYATGAPAMTVHGLGLTEHVQGTDGVMALIDLALLTGNIGRPGGGVNPLRGQNNVQGSAHMGCEPATLPGSTAIDAGRGVVEAAWGVPLPAPPGLHMLAMLDAAIAGRFKALWAIGYDVYLTNAHAAETARALAALDLLIVQDLFLTESARAFGTVFLPACSSFEHDGTFMNAERRIQRVRAAVPPVGASRADWRDPGRRRDGDGLCGVRVQRAGGHLGRGPRRRPRRPRHDLRPPRSGRAAVAVPGRGPSGHGAAARDAGAALHAASHRGPADAGAADGGVSADPDDGPHVVSLQRRHHDDAHAQRDAPRQRRPRRCRCRGACAGHRGRQSGARGERLRNGRAPGESVGRAAERAAVRHLPHGRRLPEPRDRAVS